MKKIILLTVMVSLFYNTNAQLVHLCEEPEPLDTLFTTEYYDGNLWLYQKIGDITVGMTIYETYDNYGRYYQLEIYINNSNSNSIDFFPDSIKASRLIKPTDDTWWISEIYSYNQYMQKIRTQQTLLAVLSAVSTTFTTTTTYSRYGVLYSSSHTTSSYNYNPIELITLGLLFENDRKLNSNGYWRTNTIHSNEAMVGHMKMKQKRACQMKIRVPVDGKIFVFKWDMLTNKPIMD